jgi:hypothetical protein
MDTMDENGWSGEFRILNAYNYEQRGCVVYVIIMQPLLKFCVDKWLNVNMRFCLVFIHSVEYILVFLHVVQELVTKCVTLLEDV